MITGNLKRATATLVGGVVQIAARAGVHRGNKHKVGGVGDALVGAGDSYGSVFERLAQGFEDGSGVFREFVEKKDTVVSKSDFARGSGSSATDDGNMAGGVVWGAEGAL